MFLNYNPNGAAGTLGPVVGGREDAMINTTAGILTATFLGFEAIDTDTFTFTLSSGTLSNKGALDATISGPVERRLAQFLVRRLVPGHCRRKRPEPRRVHVLRRSRLLRGQRIHAVHDRRRYDLILGFNDGLRVDADYDDMVVGLKVAAIPEPETYALLLAGLGAIGFMHAAAEPPESRLPPVGIRAGFAGPFLCADAASEFEFQFTRPARATLAHVRQGLPGGQQSFKR